MNDEVTLRVKPIHYQVLAGVGLGLIGIAQYWQRLEIANLVCLALGAWMIVFPTPRLPLLFIIMVAGVQAYVHRETHPGFQFQDSFLMFEPVDLLLAAGLLLFIGIQYRLVSIFSAIVPPEPRKTAKDGPSIPTTRPATVLTQEEILRFVVASPFWVLVGQIVWSWLYQNWSLAGFYPRFMQLAIVIWLAVVGLFIGASINGYWRRAHSDADLSRLYLQEVDWQEARREYGRMGRWIAWGKARALKKWGRPSEST